MWPLFRATLSYNRYFLAAAYLAAAVIWIMYLFDPAGMIMLFGIPAVFLMIALFTASGKEKRERLLALLPVPLKQRGLAGVLAFAILFHLGLLSLWPVQYAVARADLANEFITLPGLLALSGVVIALFILLAIHSDLQSHHKKNYKWLAAFVLVFAGGGILLLKVASHWQPAIYAFWRDLAFQTPHLAVLVNLLCGGLMYVRMITYCRRHSYLD